MSLPKERLKSPNNRDYMGKGDFCLFIQNSSRTQKNNLALN